MTADASSSLTGRRVVEGDRCGRPGGPGGVVGAAYRARGVAPGTADPVAIAEHVVAALGACVYRAVREVDLHIGIEQVLTQNRFRFEREFRLSARDRPDFMVSGCVAIEVKMRASGSEVLSQLVRYAAHRRVKALVVATPRLSSLSGMPEQILDVPVLVVALPGPGLLL